MYRVEKFNAVKHTKDVRRLGLAFCEESGTPLTAVDSLLKYLTDMEQCSNILSVGLWLDTKLIGALSAIITPNFSTYPSLVSTELHLYVDKDHRGGKAFMYLYNIWTRWCKQNNVSLMVLSNSEYISNNMKEKLGFTTSSISLIKEMDHG